MISKKLLVMMMARSLARLVLGCGDDDGDGDDVDSGPMDVDSGPPGDVDSGPPGDVDSGPPGDVDSGPMPMDPTCEEYCTTIEANCAMMNSQYPVAGADCMAYCTTNSHWDTGMRDATSGDTLACRLYHAGAAEMDPATHCDHAGPSGGDTCGSWCENLCQLAEDNCPGALNPYADTAACMTACMAYDDSGDPNDTSGDTVQCRIYHLGAAGADMAAAMTHCPHGGVVSDVCN
jgi:hypothetical protein